MGIDDRLEVIVDPVLIQDVVYYRCLLDLVLIKAVCTESLEVYLLSVLS